MCTLPISALQAAPFNLGLGESIYAKVIAYNVIGNSPDSTSGNGAVISIVVAPDAPISLARDSTTTTTSQIGLTWSDGASDGGADVEDYRVSYDQGTGNWVVLQIGVTTKSYVKMTLV
jgi:hypothetical protein